MTTPKKAEGMTEEECMRYWVAVNKSKPKLWKPADDHDFYNYIFRSKADAETYMDNNEKAVEVEMRIVRR